MLRRTGHLAAFRIELVVVGLVLGLTLTGCYKPLRRCSEGCPAPLYCHVESQLCVRPDPDAGSAIEGDGGAGKADEIECVEVPPDYRGPHRGSVGRSPPGSIYGSWRRNSQG